jgi:hypothetical protein
VWVWEALGFRSPGFGNGWAWVWTRIQHGDTGFMLGDGLEIGWENGVSGDSLSLGLLEAVVGGSNTFTPFLFGAAFHVVAVPRIRCMSTVLP